MKRIQNCIYCGEPATTRDHVPPKCFLDKPYPQNLLTLPACQTCNNSFSKDEQYFMYLSDYIFSIENGDGEFTRETVKAAFIYSDKLEDRMISSLKVEDNKICFEFETNRIIRVIQKVARGLLYTAYSEDIKISKSNFMPLTLLTKEQKLEYKSLDWIIVQEERFKYTIQNSLVYFVVNEIFLCVVSYSF